MGLASGTRLGPYEILSPIGKGGMGEVYRAQDTKLGRDVAIKVLPEEFTEHPEKLARFEREAKLLAALNHPKIATLHGLEEADGKPFLVMELVEGETLADRIARGPIPTDEALEIALQIAEGLEAAHEKGVIHRDLKPANVKVDAEGNVKVLDFGLAKAFANDEAVESDLSQSPTLSRDATRAGVIMGTAAYMSPEQAKGKTVDKRSDIFSFGAVIYEMVAGKKAFGGEDVSDVLASIIKLDIDWNALPSNLDARIQKLLVRCLKQDCKKRLRDVGDVRNEIEEILAEPASATTEQSLAVSSPNRARERAAWSIGTIVVALITGIVVWSLMRPATQPIARFSLTLPPDVSFTGTGRHVVTFSPDGARLVYGANQQLYLREMDQLEAAPIRGTDINPRSPFFSFDGQWVGFWTGGRLMKVPVTGGVPVTLCEARNPLGASWEADDTIVCGQGGGGILRVSANGGTPEVLTPIDSERPEVLHGPQMLPGGETLLFAIRIGGTWDESQIVTQSLKTGERRVLIEGGSDPRYVPTGHLVYALGDTLMAVPFDLERLAVTGGSVPVVEGVARAGTLTGAAQASFSDSGSLVYVWGLTATSRRLVWVDRNGREEALAAEPRAYVYPRISPDGSEVAIYIADQESDIWIWNFSRETLRRLTFGATEDIYPAWTPDGQRVVFGSSPLGTVSPRIGTRNLFWRAADGTGTVERLTESEMIQSPQAFTLDGKQLVYRDTDPERGFDLSVLSLDGNRSSEPLLVTEFNELNAEISPNGRWLAFESDASGQSGIYVRPFPNVDDGQFQISTAGGTHPLWSRDGTELFYLDASRRLMSVPIRTEPAFEFGNPEVILEESYFGSTGRSYDVSLDGKRFLMIKEGGEGDEEAELVLVQNWFQELERLVPTN